MRSVIEREGNNKKGKQQNPRNFPTHSSKKVEKQQQAWWGNLARFHLGTFCQQSPHSGMCTHRGLRTKMAKRRLSRGKQDSSNGNPGYNRRGRREYHQVGSLGGRWPPAFCSSSGDFSLSRSQKNRVYVLPCDELQCRKEYKSSGGYPRLPTRENWG